MSAACTTSTTYDTPAFAALSARPARYSPTVSSIRSTTPQFPSVSPSAPAQYSLQKRTESAPVQSCSPIRSPTPRTHVPSAAASPQSGDTASVAHASR